MENKPGRLTARYLKALVVARGRNVDAAAYASSQRWLEGEQIARILKAGVSATNTGDTGFLHPVAQDFAALIRPLTLIGRMQNFRRIPPNVNCITQNTGAVASWLSEGAPLPLSALTIARESLVPIRLAAIAVTTNELALLSDPNSESIILADLAAAVVERMDKSFADPENKGSPEVQPRSITYDAQKFVSSGSDIASIVADLQLLANALNDGGSDLQNATFVLNPRTATYLAGLRGTTGGPVFPGFGIRGGELLGLPALVSGSVVRTGSPQETFIALIDPSRVWLTESDRIELATSRTADLVMDDAPAMNSVVPTSTSVVSMWSTESVAMRAAQFLNWKPVTNASASSVLTGVAY